MTFQEAEQLGRELACAVEQAYVRGDSPELWALNLGIEDIMLVLMDYCPCPETEPCKYSCPEQSFERGYWSVSHGERATTK